MLLVAVPLAASADPFHGTPTVPAPQAHRDVPYLKVDGQSVLLDWYRPAQARPSDRLPAIVFINANLGQSQRAHPIYTGWAALATTHGMIAILPDAAANFDTGLDALLAYLTSHATEMGLDPDRIGVYAASSNVARTFPAVADPRRSAIRAATLYYGYSDSVVFRPDLPLLLVRAGLDRPAMNDRLDATVAAALRANAPVTVLNLPAGHHGFELLDDDAYSRAACAQTLEWMKSALEPANQAALRARAPLAEAASALLKGEGARAAALFAPLVAASPDDKTLRLSYGEALLAAGRAKEARAQLEPLRDAGLGPRDLGIPAARAAAADNDPIAAIAWLARIPKRFRPAALAADPAFSSLRDRADFKALFD